MAKDATLARRIQKTVAAQDGVIFGRPAIVYRAMYTGRDIIAQNSRFAPGYTDDRGYVPVEWWIMSLTAAGNDIPKENEGVTRLKLASGDELLLTDAVRAAGDLLLGDAAERWPLTKVLDIGGEPVVPSFGGEPEAPPIPFHTHAGEVVDGRIRPPGKLEAYFFPPVDVAPYKRDLGPVITRLGLRPDVTKERVLAAMREFGRSDALYSLGVAYEIRPYDGWTIPGGCLHAPGPWPTFEIQLPQDDFNFAAWQLGVVAEGEELEVLRRNFLLRGLQDEEDVLAQAVDWELSTDPRFKEKHYRPSRPLKTGPWGRRLQIFFDPFYGEALEIEPGQAYTRASDGRPFAGIVWCGEGALNGSAIGDLSTEAPREFLVAPGRDAAFVNTGARPLYVYTVFPMHGPSAPSIG